MTVSEAMRILKAMDVQSTEPFSAEEREAIMVLGGEFLDGRMSDAEILALVERGRERGRG